MKVKTAICSTCSEELELSPRNFHRNRGTRSGFIRQCRRCRSISRYGPTEFERLPRVKVKAANILYSLGYSIHFIARDMGATEVAVRNSVSAECPREEAA